MPDVEQPRALIVTIYGLYARQDPAGHDPAGEDPTGDDAAGDKRGWLPIAALVRLLAELNVDEPAVRSAISRLKRRGLLEASRRDGVAGYALSGRAAAILAEGDARIFTPPVPSISDGWLLAVFSVPETERAKRHTLRSHLIALGFGSAAPGVWVAPAHRFDLTSASLERLDLAAYVDLFRAEYLAFGDLVALARRWWDLAELRADYDDFITRYAPMLGRSAEPTTARSAEPSTARSAEPAVAPSAGPEAARSAPAGTAFADWVRVLTAWRRLPYRDPGLPAELLPADWPGHAAAALLADLRARLTVSADDFVRSVTTPVARRAD